MTQQNRLRGWVWRVAGSTIIVAGLGIALISAIDNFAVSILGIFLSYLGVRTLNRGRRHFVPIGLHRLSGDPRPHVLYLRPFDDDGAELQISLATINRSWAARGNWRQLGSMFRFIHTNEQYLSLAFKDIGPLVAIGDPEERLPRLGATRVYARGERGWQDLVAQLAAGARYVLLQIGRSPGLLWEVQFVVDHVRPEQLILFLPNQRLRLTRPMGPAKRERLRREHYQEFRRITAGVFPMPLPESIGPAMFMYFGPHWTPQPSYYRPTMIYPFGRVERHPDDPKLEALDWLNSVVN